MSRKLFVKNARKGVDGSGELCFNYSMSNTGTDDTVTQAEIVLCKFTKVLGKATSRKIADALHIDPATVYRWNYTKEAGGTGGVIPAKWHRPLLELAKMVDVKLTAEDIVG